MFFNSEWFRHASLKARLTAITVVLVLAVSAGVTSVALLFAQQDMRAVIGRQQYAALSSAATHLAAYLRAKQNLMAVLASSFPDGPRAQLDALHRADPALDREFFNTAAFHRDGRLVGSRQHTSATHLDRSSAGYFEQTLALGRSVISQPLRSRLTGNAVVLVTAPVLDRDGKVELVLTGSISLLESGLLQPVANLQPGKHAYPFLLSGDGTVISHPDKSLLLTNIARSGVESAAIRRGLAGFEGWIEATDHAGAPGIYAFKRVSETGWILGMFYPSAEAFAPLEAMRVKAFLATALLAALCGLLARWLIRRLLGPLESLRGAIGDIRASGATIDTLQLHSHDEIGELARAFYRLVAEREQAQARTRDSERYVRTILERAPDAFVSCDHHGVVREWNAQAERTFGWTRAEVLGRNIADIIVPQRFRAAHREGMQAFGAAGAHRTIEGRIRLQALHRDGYEIPVELSLSSYEMDGRFGASAFLHDISSQLIHEQRVLAGERRLRLITDRMPALIARLGTDLRFEFCNAHYQRLFGLAPEAMIGRSIGEVFGEQFVARWQAQVEAALAGHEVNLETDLQFKGQTHYFIASVLPERGEDGQVEALYLMATDITERRESELRQAESERRAGEASRAKSEFVANMSHEIRTPMNAVLGFTQLLGNTALSDEQQQYLKLIRTAGASLTAVLNDILDFSKIEAGHLSLAHAPFSLFDLLDAAGGMMTLHGGGEKRLEMMIGVDPAAPVALVGDLMRMQQILGNLIGNAVKFTDAGSVSLQVGLGRLEPGLAELSFAVQDTGIGIDSASQARLFSPFTQVDTSATRRFGGTGLGLAICQRLAGLMGGAITVASTPGQGCRFTVTIPFALGADPGQRAGAGRRLLVLDGDAGRAARLASVAQAAGWQAQVAPHPAAACKALSAAGRAGAGIDAVLVDSSWCDEHNGAMLDTLRLLLGPQRPLLAVASAYEQDHPGRKACLRRAGQVLLKPVTPNTLAEVVRGAVAGAPAMAAAPRLDGVRLLLVEDNLLNQVVARTMLEQAGARVELAGNGQAALEQLAGEPDGFDLVLMDVQMPVLDGIAATRELRDRLGLALPVLAMTAGVLESEQQLCREAGMNGLVPKPIDERQMLSTIAAHLQPAAPAAAQPGAPPADSGRLFDVRALEELCALQPAQRPSLLALVRETCRSLPGELAGAHAAWRDGDPAAAARILHAARGALGLLGARRFGDAALALEHALREGRQQAVEAGFEAATEALDATLDAAAGWLAAEPGGGA